MQGDTTIILADLGGTRLRLARAGVADVKSYAPGDFAGLQDAIRAYAGDTTGAQLFLSFAKKVNEGGVYTLDQAHKKGAWSFTIDAVKRDLGLSDMQVLHDMQAMGRAVFHTAPVFEQVTGGAQGDGWRSIINVGTGLGHAFIDPETRGVRDTFGGHFPPIAVTHEQREALRLLEQNFHEDRSFIWEEILSGRGIAALDEQTMDGTRLFCEFLGLYANTLSVSADAFGGLYFGGGVMEDLFETGNFDVDAFLKFFLLHNVPIVDQALRACPVYRSNLPHIALYGLDVYARRLSYH